MQRADGAKKFLVNLSSDLRAKLPGVKGLSETSIGYAKRFYLLYNEWFTIHPQVGGELQESAIWCIPWGHHKYICIFRRIPVHLISLQKTV